MSELQKYILSEPTCPTLFYWKLIVFKFYFIYNIYYEFIGSRKYVKWIYSVSAIQWVRFFFVFWCFASHSLLVFIEILTFLIKSILLEFFSSKLSVWGKITLLILRRTIVGISMHCFFSIDRLTYWWQWN